VHKIGDDEGFSGGVREEISLTSGHSPAARAGQSAGRIHVDTCHQQATHSALPTSRTQVVPARSSSPLDGYPRRRWD
jgi:hypothetical protein